MADLIIGSAFVEVKPEPASIKSFAPTVRTQLTAELKKSPLKLSVTPTISGPWKSRMQSELRTAS